jgi:hypothetical protein
MTDSENRIENPNVDFNNNDVDTTADYIATLDAMRKNSVSRADYDKVREENRRLLNTLAEGGSIQVAEEKPQVDIQAIRKELFSPTCDLNNLQYIEKALELRDALIENGEADPFLPVSSSKSPTYEEISQAENAARVFRECVEYADGDSQVFTQELMRRTNDSNPMAGNRRSR